MIYNTKRTRTVRHDIDYQALWHARIDDTIVKFINANTSPSTVTVIVECCAFLIRLSWVFTSWLSLVYSTRHLRLNENRSGCLPLMIYLVFKVYRNWRKCTQCLHYVWISQMEEMSCTFILLHGIIMLVYWSIFNKRQYKIVRPISLHHPPTGSQWGVIGHTLCRLCKFGNILNWATHFEICGSILS